MTPIQPQSSEIRLEQSTLDALQTRLRGPLLLPGEPGYDDARSLWNAMIDKRPALIARCLGVADVIAGEVHAREQGLAPALGRTVLLALALLFLMATRSFALDFGADSNPVLVLDSHKAGRSPAHRLSFDVSSGELEIYRAVLTYPDGFRFQGFDALGPANTSVGAYEIDFNADGIAERTVPLRSLTPNSAYADVLTDEAFSPDLEPVLEQGGGAEFHLRLPFGGDANPDTLVVPFDARLSLVLFSGLLANPDAGGIYTVNATLTSVDPDTDGADNGLSEPPVSVSGAADVSIEDVLFAELRIDKADLKLQDGPGDRCMVHGRFRLAGASDGIDPPHEEVTVTFDQFGQRIPGDLFSPTGNGFHFKDKGPGIKQLKLQADGQFEVDARDLALERLDPNRPVRFTLQIGDDRGEVEIPFDRNGHYRP